MRQLAIDVDYSFLNGTYQQATAANVAARTRGIITACTTNTVDAAGATLSKDLIDELLREMADNGASFINAVIFCNALQKQRLSNIALDNTLASVKNMPVKGAVHFEVDAWLVRGRP